jgi:hypothetical protein
MTDEKIVDHASQRIPLDQQILGVLRARPQLRNAALTLCLVAIPLSLVPIWFVWFKWVPQLWAWAFSELSITSIPKGVAVYYVAALPASLPVFAVLLTAKVLGLYAEAESARATEAVSRGSTEQARVEEELKEIDKSGLVLLLRYSRVQLEAYYGIGLTQTQRSFLYSVIAMWIGFTVILAGIVIRVVDLEKIGFRLADPDVSTLAILSGIIIEVISALFLWVYRSSVRQLTYFYDRQMYNHSVLMCHRIAETMQAADEVKKAIVEKVLDKGWAVQQEALPQAERLMSFGSKKQ